MKEKQDDAEVNLIGLMKKCNLTKFKHDGLTVEISDRAKAIVKTERNEDDAGDDE